MAEQDPDNKDLVVVSPANHLSPWVTCKYMYCTVLLNKPYV